MHLSVIRKGKAAGEGCRAVPGAELQRNRADPRGIQVDGHKESVFAAGAARRTACLTAALRAGALLSARPDVRRHPQNLRKGEQVRVHHAPIRVRRHNEPLADRVYIDRFVSGKGEGREKQGKQRFIFGAAGEVAPDV